MPVTEFAMLQNHFIGRHRPAICCGMTIIIGCWMSIHVYMASCIMLRVVDLMAWHLGVGGTSLLTSSCDM